MAKLNRLTAKIFGETASTTNTPKEIGQFGSAKAGTYNATGDVATIQNLPAWSNGWIDAVTPTDQFPPLPEMTGVHKVLSYQNAYLLQQGIPEWDSATTYYTNGFCSKNGNIYVSQSDNNLNNDPSSDSVNWLEYTQDLSNLANVDLTNVTQTGKNNVTSWGIPDWTDRKAGVTGFNVWKTVSVDSWVSVLTSTTNVNRTLWLKIANESGTELAGCVDNNGFIRAQQGYSGTANQVFAVIPKNYSYCAIIDGDQVFGVSYEYPLKGAN